MDRGKNRKYYLIRFKDYENDINNIKDNYNLKLTPIKKCWIDMYGDYQLTVSCSKKYRDKFEELLNKMECKYIKI